MLAVAGPQLPDLGDGGEMTSSAERRLGEKIVRELYRDPDYIDDAVLAEYVQGVWQPLLAAARVRGDLQPELEQRFAWEILMGRERTINAFALPGGYFGLHLGLIGAVGSRDELASVLAHELSHVTQRHISRLISRQGAQTPWLIGAMILAALAASKNPEAANAVALGGQAVAVQNQLNFSRDMEREADRTGFGVMTQAGFESRAFVSMFDKLQQSARFNDNGSFPYLRSHPLTTERMADMLARQPAGGAPSFSSGAALEHAMVAARARVLSSTGVDALRAWLADANNQGLAGLATPRSVAVLYGAALAATRLRDFSRAQALVTQLAGLTGADARCARLTRLLAAELALAAGDAARAASLLAAASMGRPDVLLWSQAVMRSGQPGAAAQRLQVWVATYPRDAAAWQLLSAAHGAQGQTLRAIRADAEVKVIQLDYAAAAQRLRAAQEQVRSARPGVGVDHFEASIIDSRAREVQVLLQEQARER